MNETITITPELINTIADSIGLYKIRLKESSTRFGYDLLIGTSEKFVALEITEEQGKLIEELIKEVKKSNLEIIDKDKAKKEYAQKIYDMFYEKAKDLELTK